MPNSRTAAIAPSTLTRGASSPPIASTAIRTLASLRCRHHECGDYTEGAIYVLIACLPL